MNPSHPKRKMHGGTDCVSDIVDVSVTLTEGLLEKVDESLRDNPGLLRQLNHGHDSLSPYFYGSTKLLVDYRTLQKQN